MILFERRKPAIHILPAGTEDAADLAAIHGASFARAWSDGEFEAMLLSRGVNALIARNRNGSKLAPLGFALVRRAGEEAEIITIATMPKSRRRGVGRALMSHAIRELRQEGVARLLLEVDGGNPAAIGLYHSLGFRQIAVRHGYYRADEGGGASAGTAGNDGHGPSDALVMELDLR